MARFGRHTKLIYTLVVIAILEFAALAGVLFYSDSLFRQDIGPAGTGSADEPAEPAAFVEPLPPEKEPPENELTAPEILNNANLIAHGMGTMEDVTTLNCLEGFQTYYANGVRVFEVDLRMTSDLQVVLRHDWRAYWQEGISETAVPTLEEFLQKPYLDQYTPLSFKDLLLLLEEYPDVCIVTDTKFIDAEIVKLQFEAMLQDARELGLSYLFDRFVVQIYSPLMFKEVESVHHFPYYIYTLYQVGFARTEEDFRKKADFCVRNGIMGITMAYEVWSEQYAPLAEEYGLKVYTHTVNDSEIANAQLAAGVSGVYTDTLIPAALSG